VTTAAWVVRLTAAAEADLQAILRWTVQHFGTVRAQVYAETLTQALTALAAGPSSAGVKARDDIAEGLYTLHVARNRRRGRHFILFRMVTDERRSTVDVLRVLHDAVDLTRHVPREERGGAED
jgi:toxin ParE1/3/4